MRESTVLENTTEQFTPCRGFTVKPEAGRKIFVVALVCFLVVTILPWCIRFIGGADYCARIWDAKMSPASPIALINDIEVLGGMALVMWHSITVKGTKRALIAFFSVFFIAWFNEFLGTNYGLVFGPYHYTAAIPYHILGVPAIVAPAWEIILYPAFYLSLYLMPSEVTDKVKSVGQKILTTLMISAVGAFIVTCNDMLRDPLWVQYGGWVWHTTGPYVSYLDTGEPISNFTGWLLVAFEIQITYHLILNSTPVERHIRSKYLDIYTPLLIYASGLTFGMAIELIFQRHADVALIGIMTIGMVVLMVITKLYLEKQMSRPNPIGIMLSEKSL